MIRKLIKLIVLLIVLVIGGAIAAYIYIDTIAKAAVERGSTYALGVNTTVKSAKVKILDGQFVMKGLEVANPEGYKTPHFLTLKKGDVAVSLGTLRQEIIELPHLKLNDIDVNLEKKDGKTNYQVILDNLKRLESGEETSEGGKRYIIKKLTITNGNVHVDTVGGGGVLQQVGKLDIPIEEIRLKDVGSETGRGVLLSELTGVILKAILGTAINKGGDEIPTDMLGDLSARLAQLKDIRNIADVEKLPGDLGSIGETAKETIGKTLGNILGGEDKNHK